MFIKCAGDDELRGVGSQTSMISASVPNEVEDCIAGNCNSCNTVGVARKGWVLRMFGGLNHKFRSCIESEGLGNVDDFPKSSFSIIAEWNCSSKRLNP